MWCFIFIDQIMVIVSILFDNICTVGKHQFKSATCSMMISSVLFITETTKGCYKVWCTGPSCGFFLVHASSNLSMNKWKIFRRKYLKYQIGSFMTETFLWGFDSLAFLSSTLLPVRFLCSFSLHGHNQDFYALCYVLQYKKPLSVDALPSFRQYSSNMNCISSS